MRGGDLCGVWGWVDLLTYRADDVMSYEQRVHWDDGVLCKVPWSVVHGMLRCGVVWCGVVWWCGLVYLVA